MAFMGMEWIIVIIAIVLLLFGAKKIPEFARNLGKARAEFSRGQQMVDREIREVDRADREEEKRLDREAARKEKEEERAEELSGDDLEKAAWEAGINPEGKTEDELRILVKAKAKKD
jgi:sec-independent protein translocase protein TatA